MHTFKFTIPAGASERIATRADFVRCMASTGAFTLRINGATRLEDFGVGLSYSATPDDEITQIVIENTSGAEIEVSLYVGRGAVQDARLSLVTGAAITQKAAASWSHASITVAAATTEICAAADSARTEIIITNVGVEAVWIRSTATTGSGGVRLAPEAAIVLTLSAAVYCYNPSFTASVPIQVAELFA